MLDDCSKDLDKKLKVNAEQQPKKAATVKDDLDLGGDIDYSKLGMNEE